MLYNRLQGLGATPVVRRGDGDDQHDLGMDFELDLWSKELWSSLLALYPLPPTVAILPDKQKYLFFFSFLFSLFSFLFSLFSFLFSLFSFPFPFPFLFFYKKNVNFLTK
jgi:hypothetical protein